MNIGFIGLGKMGMALAEALSSEKTEKITLWGYDISDEAVKNFCDKTGGSHMFSDKMVNHCDVIILCVKPQQLKSIASSLQSAKKPLFISILAGIPLDELTHHIGSHRIVRVMPNLSALCRQGISAYCTSKQIENEDLYTVERILKLTGSCYEVPESMMDAITGLTGSGIAYVMTFIQGLIDGGVRAGIPRNMATQMTLDLLKGSVELLQTTHAHPIEIRDQVCSPSGTTIQAVALLERTGFAGIVADAVISSTSRSQALAKNAKEQQ